MKHLGITDVSHLLQSFFDGAEKIWRI